MRFLALIAFMAVQLSVFTCGFDIHVHAMDADDKHVVEYFYDANSKQDQSSVDYGCHVHASHTFNVFDAEYIEMMPSVSTVQYFILSEAILLKIPLLIEHPPKLIRS